MEQNETPLRQSSSLQVFSQKLLIVLGFSWGLYILYSLGSVLAILFFSGFLTILFSPLLSVMNRKKIPDWLGIIFIFLWILVFFFIALFAIIPIFTKQIILLFVYIGDTLNAIESLYKSGGVNALWFPAFLQTYIETVDFGTLFGYIRGNISSISSVIGSLSKNVLMSSGSLVSSISGGIFQAIMIGVFTFFMTLERHAIRAFLYSIFPKTLHTYMIQRESAFLGVLLAWMRGQIILCWAIFLITYAGLFSLQLFDIKIDNMFTLALIAGLMEFIPYVWPFLALLPALAIAAWMGFIPVITILILYILIQQAENNILVPMVMSKTLDLSPFLILLMMTIMASLLGIIWILLAIPFAAILQIVVKDILMWRKREESWTRLTRKTKSI